MARINCSVSNCHYWAKNNICNASEVLITSDALGEAEPDEVDAPRAQMMQETPVDSCMSTCCKTFAEQGSASKFKVDGVTRNPY